MNLLKVTGVDLQASTDEMPRHRLDFNNKHRSDVTLILVMYFVMKELSPLQLFTGERSIASIEC